MLIGADYRHTTRLGYLDTPQTARSWSPAGETAARRVARRPIGLTLAWLLMLGSAAWAQQSASSGIVGQVTDSTAAAIPGATVTVINGATGAQRITTTDNAGRFSVLNLVPTTYRIRVELSGFRTAEVEGLVLPSGEILTPTIAMALGAVDETITVQASETLLQTTSASVGQVIGQKQIEDLPLSGRGVLSLAALSAGVTPRTFTRGTQYGRRNQYITVEGGRDSSTNYAVDGVYVRSLRFNNLSLNPPLDAVQEVSLLRNSFSTEYGQGQAVVSIVTKSGTNELHGSAYEFIRNDRFDARNYFAATKPEYKRNQFGFTGGGPLIKNKLFVFGGYEGLRTTQGQPFLASVPDPRLLSGDFSSLSTPIIDPLTGQPFAGNIVPASRFSRFASILKPTVPEPNNAAANNYRVVRNFIDDADTFTLRGDQTVSTSHSLFQRYMHYNGSQLQPAAFTTTEYPQRGRNLAVGHTWVISPTWVNEVRFGYNYAYHLILPLSLDDRNWVQDIGLRNLAGATDPIDFGRPGFTISGFSGNGEGGITQGATENIFSISNATSRVAGAHNIRFGVQAQFRRFEHLTEVPPRGGFTFNGTYTGNPVSDFLLGYCSTCTGAFGSSRSNYRSPTVAPFFDDVWQVSNRLTLQLGLRWEYLAPWQETNDQEGVFDQATGKIAYHQVPATIPASLAPLIINENDRFPAGILSKDWNNWAPRAGAVYNLTNRTVIRAGFGVYYDNLNLNELQFTRLVPPFYGQYSINPPRTAPISADTLFPDLGDIAQFPAPFSVDPDNETPYTVQWNVNVQRSLGRNYMVEVAYTASETKNLTKRLNINQADFGTTPIATRLPYPQFQPAILTSADIGYAEFKGLSVRLEKRYSGGLFFLTSYQLSENRDNNSGETEANDTAFRTDPDADYGGTLVRPDGVRASRGGIPGHLRPQYAYRPRNAPDGFFRQQAVPARAHAARVPRRGLQPFQQHELRAARLEHLERHGGGHLDRRRCEEHAIRLPVGLVRRRGFPRAAMSRI
jgi:outer membrane receptor protein involved in Fe transport